MGDKSRQAESNASPFVERINSDKRNRWPRAIIEGVTQQMREHPRSAVTIVMDRIGSLNKQLEGGKIIPSKLHRVEQQNFYIDLRHSVERGKAEIADARKLFRSHRSVKRIGDEFLPKTLILWRVVETGGEDVRTRRGVLERILTTGERRGRHTDAGYVHDYLAQLHGVEPKTIRNWISAGVNNAKEYSEHPERYASEFGLDLTAMLALSMKEREDCFLGLGIQTAELTTMGPIGVSDLSEPNGGWD